MKDLRIAVVQMRSQVGDTAGNLARIERFTREAAGEKVDILCFPELCICGYNAGNTSLPEPEPLGGDSVKNLEAIARGSSTTLLAGLLEQDTSGIVYNTQVICGPEGIVGSYRKTHVPTSEIGTWHPGGDLPVFAHPKASYGVEICYDSHFPEVSTILAEKGAEILFLPHASAGGGETGETAAAKKARWLRYMPARAYDNTVYVVVCNQVGDNGAGFDFPGVSFICDPRGVVIAAARGDGEEMVVAELQEARSVTDTFFAIFVGRRCMIAGRGRGAVVADGPVEAFPRSYD